MILTSAIAKDLEKLILKTNFDPVKIKSKLDFYLERKRVTVKEYNYLIESMNKRIDKESTK